MNVVCTHCSHEFEVAEEVVTQSGGATKCPTCGEETSLGPLPSGATLPWHPEMDAAPPAPPEAPEASEASEASGTPGTPGTPALGKPKEQSVLFKLGEMQAMGAQSSARQSGGPPEASGLLDIRMLAATIQYHEQEERAAHNVQFVGRAKASGPMALPTSSPVFAPASAGRKGLGGILIAAAVVFVVLIVVALVLVYFVYAGKTKTSTSGAEATDSETQASAAMTSETPSMRAAGMDAMEPAMAPTMRVVAMDAMEPVPTMEPEKPKKPKKRPRKLRRKHIKEGVATVSAQIADCKKDRKGRFKLRITVVGKTGKVKRVRISGRKKRKSKTGKCLTKLFKKAQFTPFKRRRQSFTHRVRIK